MTDKDEAQCHSAEARFVAAWEEDLQRSRAQLKGISRSACQPQKLNPTSLVLTRHLNYTKASLSQLATMDRHSIQSIASRLSGDYVSARLGRRPVDSGAGCSPTFRSHLSNYIPTTFPSSMTTELCVVRTSPSPSTSVATLMSILVGARCGSLLYAGR